MREHQAMARLSSAARTIRLLLTAGQRVIESARDRDCPTGPTLLTTVPELLAAHETAEKWLKG